MTPMYAKLANLSVRASVGAGLAGVLADLAGVRSLLVTVLVLVFIAVAPTAVIAGLLRGFDLFARLVIAWVTSIAVITLIAMIMLAIGAWSPKAGLAAIALVSGACLLAQHASHVSSRIAQRAEPLRQSMIDYCVAVGGERTAHWAVVRMEPKPDPDGDNLAGTTQGERADEPVAPHEKAGDDTDEAIAHMDGHVTVTAEHGTGAANGEPPATDGPAEKDPVEPQVIVAESAAEKPPRFRDTA